MPEGPEVYTIASELRPLITGKVINLIESCSDRKWILKSIDQIPTPVKIMNVRSHGKKLIFELENKGMIVSSFGMTGRWSFARESYCHLMISFGPKTIIRGTDGSNIGINIIEKTIFFSDPSSKGGQIEYISASESLAYLSSFGPDLLGGEITSHQWIAIFTNPKIAKWEICKAIADQHLVMGIGNYLRAEILYRTKIAPMRLVGSLTSTEWEALRIHAHQTIRESCMAGGLTIKDFWAPSGKKGIFKKVVYKERTDPYGNAVEAYKRLKGDQTCYWVPNMQR